MAKAKAEFCMMSTARAPNLTRSSNFHPVLDISEPLSDLSSRSSFFRLYDTPPNMAGLPVVLEAGPFSILSWPLCCTATVHGDTTKFVTSYNVYVVIRVGEGRLKKISRVRLE